MTFPTSVLSTYARNDNQGGRRKTAVLRRQSDDSSRIDRDALGRFWGGGNVRLGAVLNGSFDATNAGWLAQNTPTMVVPEKSPFTERPVARRALGFH